MLAVEVARVAPGAVRAGPIRSTAEAARAAWLLPACSLIGPSRVYVVNVCGELRQPMTCVYI